MCDGTVTPAKEDEESEDRSDCVDSNCWGPGSRLVDYVHSPRSGLPPFRSEDTGRGVTAFSVCQDCRSGSRAHIDVPSRAVVGYEPDESSPPETDSGGTHQTEPGSRSLLLELGVPEDPT